MPAIPVLIQVLVVFAAIVAASAKKVHLGLAAALGGIAFALWRGVPLAQSLEAAATELLNPDTWLLLLLMAGIMAFSSAMKKAGAMSAFSAALEGIAPSPRVAMATAPLLIGTLPMPGGAILSAPLVDAMDPARSRGRDTLSTANYWFRHNLELAWPLYPSFILAASLSGLPAGRLMLFNLYAPFLLFTLGLIFILPTLPAALAASPATERAPLAVRLRTFFSAVAPLALVLGSYVLLDIAWKLASPTLPLDERARVLIGRYVPISLGLLVGCARVMALPSGAGAFKGSLGPSALRLILVIAGIRVFSALLGAAGVAQASASELASAGIPAFIAVAALPLVAGLVTGIGFGYVGLTYPIILGLIGADGSIPLESAVVLAGAFGFAGMMLSPLHVCMVVSAEHFGSGLAAMIRRFLLPLAIFLTVATGYSWALSRLLGH